MGKALKKKLVDVKMSSTVAKVQLGQETREDENLSEQSKKEVKSGPSVGKPQNSDASNGRNMGTEGWKKSTKHAACPPTSTTQQRGDRSVEAVVGCEKMAKEVVEEFEKRIKKCYSHRGREVLRGALHVLMCSGCGDDRFLVL